MLTLLCLPTPDLYPCRVSTADRAEGRTLHAANAPYRPGRGDGVGDMPGLKIIGDVDPSDIKQVGMRAARTRDRPCCGCC
jgi:hypothetical protein